MSLFDRKFGADFLSGIPTQPGIYRYFSAEGVLLYVGKARNLRRRLQSYRLAPPTKRGRKARRIIKASQRLEVQVCASELDALLEELKVIQTARPRFNVANAYAFLYPFLALKREPGLGGRERVILALGTREEELVGLECFGVYRDRALTKLALESLTRLLALIGHLEPARTLKGLREHALRTRLRALRRIPSELVTFLVAFLRGESKAFLGALAVALLESESARAQAAEIHQELRVLERFFHAEAEALWTVCQTLKWHTYPVSQEERDALFIRVRKAAL